MTASAQPPSFGALPSFITPAEGRMFMAMKMFELGKLTLPQAAEIAGYSVGGFVDVLAHHSIPAIDYPAGELAAETTW